MRPTPLQGLLLISLGLAGWAHVALSPDPSRRNFVYAPEMTVSPGYEAQDPNPNFPDGKTLQRPVEGTIARGFAPPEMGGTPLDLSEPDWAKLSPEQQALWDAYAPPWAGQELDQAGEGALARRGEALFLRFCVTCHGATGGGDGASVKRGVPPPPSYSAPEIVALSDGRMFRSLTLGKGNMASYASQVAREDRWKVIRHIRSLQRSP